MRLQGARSGKTEGGRRARLQGTRSGKRRLLERRDEGNFLTILQGIKVVNIQSGLGFIRLAPSKRRRQDE